MNLWISPPNLLEASRKSTAMTCSEVSNKASAPKTNANCSPSATFTIFKRLRHRMKRKSKVFADHRICCSSPPLPAKPFYKENIPIGDTSSTRMGQTQSQSFALLRRATKLTSFQVPPMLLMDRLRSSSPDFSSSSSPRSPLRNISNALKDASAAEVMDHIKSKWKQGDLSTQFQSVDEVQDLIKQLQKLEANMLAGGEKRWCSSFEELPVMDRQEYQIEENETEWLVKIPGERRLQPQDLVNDESYLDSGLLNVRHTLANLIKKVIVEEKTAKLKASPPLPPANIINPYQTYKRPTPPVAHRRPVSPLPFRPFRVEPDPGLMLDRSNTYDDEGENEFVEMSSPPKPSSYNTYNKFTSPTSRPPLSRQRDTDAEMEYLYASTPSAKNIDSRTYTRPKKNRMPLETRNFPVSPIRSAASLDLSDPEFNLVQDVDVDQNVMPNGLNMNETFTADDPESDQVMGGLSPPRKVTRNLSYVIRRDSADSPNNNSPGQPAENVENGSVELNNTFVARSREDVYSPSPTGSSNSIHTSSMEELHNMARLQEQTLRMSSSTKVLTRKDTQVIRPGDLPSYRPATQPADSQTGAPKLRVQSRIPAPGLASRLRPPMANGTRRPITSGGIRRAPDWQDDGAY